MQLVAGLREAGHPDAWFWPPLASWPSRLSVNLLPAPLPSPLAATMAVSICHCLAYLSLTAFLWSACLLQYFSRLLVSFPCLSVLASYGFISFYSMSAAAFTKQLYAQCCFAAHGPAPYLT